MSCGASVGHTADTVLSAPKIEYHVQGRRAEPSHPIQRRNTALATPGTRRRSAATDTRSPATTFGRCRASGARNDSPGEGLRKSGGSSAVVLIFRWREPGRLSRLRDLCQGPSPDVEFARHWSSRLVTFVLHRSRSRDPSRRVRSWESVRNKHQNLSGFQAEVINADVFLVGVLLPKRPKDL